jgi:hypothetical protein
MASKLPSKIRLGSQVWDVSVQKRKHASDDGHYGFTNAKDNTIVLDAELPESMLRTTLLHELLHAIGVTFGGSFKPAKATDYLDWEHYWIGLYEEPLVMLLRDNPELVGFLLADD